MLMILPIYKSFKSDKKTHSKLYSLVCKEVHYASSLILLSLRSLSQD